MNKKNEGQGFPPATERTLQILDYFISDPSSKTLKTISEQLDIPTSSLYRIVSCMQAYNYIAEEPTRPNYFKLGYKCSQLSTTAFTENDLINLARPFMEELTRTSNQACQLCALTENRVCTLYQCLPLSTITYISELGEKLPVNITAAGKLLTALLPSQKQASFLKRAAKDFRRNTPHTITALDEFQKELDRIRRLGYATDVEEYAPGIGCIAVPIYDVNEAPIAAIGVTGPIKFYQNMNHFNIVLEELLNISGKLQKLLQ